VIAGGKGRGFRAFLPYGGAVLVLMGVAGLGILLL